MAEPKEAKTIEEATELGFFGRVRNPIDPTGASLKGAAVNSDDAPEDAQKSATGPGAKSPSKQAENTGKA